MRLKTISTLLPQPYTFRCEHGAPYIGTYGIYEGSHPLAIWHGRPVPHPQWEATGIATPVYRDDLNPDGVGFDGVALDLAGALHMPPDRGHRLWLACEQAGYREQEHGYLAVWLCHTFGVALDLMYGPLAE